MHLLHCISTYMCLFQLTETIYMYKSKGFNMHPFIHSSKNMHYCFNILYFLWNRVNLVVGVCYCKFPWRALTHEVALQSALRSPSWLTVHPSFLGNPGVLPLEPSQPSAIYATICSISKRLIIRLEGILPANSKPALPGINGGGVFPSPPRIANPVTQLISFLLWLHRLIEDLCLPASSNFQ